MRFSLRGTEDALKNLEAIEQSVSDDNLREDALDAVQPVVEDARNLAPVGEGDLRDSIGAIALEGGAVAVVIADWKGHFFEFGTVKMRAQPMLVPAWEANEDRMLDTFGRLVRARIEAPANTIGFNRSRAAVSFEP